MVQKKLRLPKAQFFLNSWTLHEGSFYIQGIIKDSVNTEYINGKTLIIHYHTKCTMPDGPDGPGYILLRTNLGMYFKASLPDKKT